MFSFSDVFRQRDFSRVPGTREFHGWERSLGFNHLSFFRISMQLLYTYALIHLIDMMQLNCGFFVGFPAPLDAEESDSFCLLGKAALEGVAEIAGIDGLRKRLVSFGYTKTLQVGF